MRASIYIAWIGACLYFAAAVMGDLRQVGGALASLHTGELAAIFGLSLLNYALRFVRWQWYLVTMGHSLPPSISLVHYMAGFALTMSPAKAGEAIRSVYLKKHGVTYRDSLAALVCERLMDLLAIVVLACLTTVWFEHYRWLILITGVAVLLGVGLLAHSGFVNMLRRWSADQPSSALRSLGHKLHALLDTSRRLLQLPAIYGALLLGLLAWGAEGLGLYYNATGMGLSLSPSQAIGIYAVSVLAGAVSFLPGGLGSTEAVMGLLLVLSGADPARAVAATLLCRIATLWFGIAIGSVAIGTLEWRSSRLPAH